MSSTTQCTKWKMADANHWNGLCTNTFRRVYDANAKVSGDCEICVTPRIESHTPCCCPEPKTSQRVLKLVATYTGGGVQPCYINAAFGTFLLYGNDCGFVSKERQVQWTSVFPEICVDLPSSAQRWHIVPGECFAIGANMWMSASIIYSYRTISGSVSTISLSGVIPACNDIDGSWVFASGPFPTPGYNWSIVVSSI